MGPFTWRVQWSCERRSSEAGMILTSNVRILQSRNPKMFEHWERGFMYFVSVWDCLNGEYLVPIKISFITFKISQKFLRYPTTWVFSWSDNAINILRGERQMLFLHSLKKWIVIASTSVVEQLKKNSTLKRIWVTLTKISYCLYSGAIVSAINHHQSFKYSFINHLKTISALSILAL